MNLIFFFISKIYMAALHLYNFFIYIGIAPTHRFSIPIISIGNITLGGSGKTPFVYYLSQILTQYKIRHVIVSRGYKRTSSGTCVVHDGKTMLPVSPSNCGDEPFMLASQLEKTPIVVDNKKVRAIKYAITHFSPQIVLLDDSFQSKYIEKNLDIVLFNTLTKPGELQLFPLGKLRENIKSLHRADLVIFTKHNLLNTGNSTLKMVLPTIKEYQVPYIYSEMHSSLIQFIMNHKKPRGWKKIAILQNLSELNKLFSFCGIGDPDSFERTTVKYKKNIVKHVSFADHYSYCQNETVFLKRLQILYQDAGVTGLITTYKDFVKIQSLSRVFLDWCYKVNFSFFIVDIKINIVDEDWLIQKTKNLIL